MRKLNNQDIPYDQTLYDAIEVLDTETIQDLLRLGNEYLADLNGIIEKTIGRIWTFFAFVLTAFSSLVAVLALQLCATWPDIPILIASAWGAAGFGAMLFYVALSLMHRVSWYPHGKEPSMAARKDVLDRFVGQDRFTCQKYTLGWALADVQHSIDYNKEVQYRLIRGYRLEVCGSLAILAVGVGILIVLSLVI